MTDIDHFVYDDTLNFTEEILLENEATIFDIVVRYSECEGFGDFVKNTSISKACYYYKFIEKLLNLKPSKRKRFVEYQAKLRTKPELFLIEFNDLIEDYGEYLGDLKNDYVEIIHEISSKDLSQNEMKDENMVFDIFISHAAKDVETVKILIELLQLAFRIENEKIRCTSVPGFKLKSGDNVDATLLNDIKTSKLILGLMSQNSLESPYVLFEIGASWGANKIPMLIAKNKGVFYSLPKPLSNFHHTSLDESSDVHDLLIELGKRLGYENYNAARLDSKIKDLVENCKISSLEIKQKETGNNADDKKAKLEQIILSYTKSTEDGTIRVISSKGSTAIQIDQNVLIDSNLHKELVPYIEVLDNLVKTGYLKIDASGKRYKFTSKAYNL